MSVVSVQMESEWREAPSAVRRQQAALADPLAALVARLRQRPPLVVVTCSRGSSAHAATFAKHLIERYLRIPVAEAAPNITAVYRQQLQLKGQLFLAISQSGRSDDLVEQARAARAVGAVTTCLVNDVASPLAHACEFILPMQAGPERSVAASKTFVASLAALVRFAAAWIDSEEFGAALARLPERLSTATELDWSAALTTLMEAPSLVTIGRGPTLPIAREASLKFKETCNLHAEAFSGAEFLHGPVALVSTRYPLLLFMPTDAAQAGMQELAYDLRTKGAAVFATDAGEPGPGHLPALAPEHPETDAICLIQTFYGLIVRLAALLGTDVDRPRHLQKVTRTR